MPFMHGIHPVHGSHRGEARPVLQGSVLVTIPKGIARELGIKRGHYIEFEVIDGRIVLRPVFRAGDWDAGGGSHRELEARTGPRDKLRELVVSDPETAAKYFGPEITRMFCTGQL